MNPELTLFAARLRDSIASGFQHEDFDALAVELFGLQFEHNALYQKFCRSRNRTPSMVCSIRGTTPSFVGRWTEIPFIGPGAFKNFEISCIPPAERTAVFHSSGTTEHNPSRHFHSPQSLEVYEASLWKCFQNYFGRNGDLLFLTPHPASAPSSSLVYMFETVRRMSGQPESAFTGNVSADGSWAVDLETTHRRLQLASDTGKHLVLLGTAFSFVHLLDDLVARGLCYELPFGSRVMETGGYKNRSRTLPKTKLHALITKQLGIPAGFIISEYGMSELSSQAYAMPGLQLSSDRDLRNTTHFTPVTGHFHFPPWTRVQIISPETGREVAEGEPGLIRVFDLANVFSVAAVQTEDLAIRRGHGFELIGRSQLAAPRGCSLMSS